MKSWLLEEIWRYEEFSLLIWLWLYLKLIILSRLTKESASLIVDFVLCRPLESCLCENLTLWRLNSTKTELYEDGFPWRWTLWRLNSMNLTILLTLGWHEEDSRLLHTLLLALCSNRQSSRVALARFQEFMEYADVRYTVHPYFPLSSMLRLWD